MQSLLPKVGRAVRRLQQWTVILSEQRRRELRNSFKKGLVVIVEKSKREVESSNKAVSVRIGCPKEQNYIGSNRNSEEPDLFSRETFGASAAH